MQPFIPHRLPVAINWEGLIEPIAAANRELARYDGLLESVPNPHVLLSPMTTQEAVLSSKIEGTQATLQQVLQFEADPQEQTQRKDDIFEVINYRRAMRSAVTSMSQRGLTLNLIKDTHTILLQGVRGEDKDRGNFRRSQNWIGSKGSTIETARFVPPSPAVLPEALDNFEKYIHMEEKDRLAQLAIIHGQFEIIHPFQDGNGRLGRILIPLFLFDKALLHQPVFYLSAYLEAHRDEYVDRLKQITDNNDWEQWIRFFLDALTQQARNNIYKTRQITALYDSMKTEIVERTRSQFAIQALDCLFNMVIFSSSDFTKFTQIPKASAHRILSQMSQAGTIDVLREGKGRRPYVYQFTRLFHIVNSTI